MHNLFITFEHTFAILRKAVAENTLNFENDGGEDAEEESDSNEDETDEEFIEDETAEENLENHFFNLTQGEEAVNWMLC